MKKCLLCDKGFEKTGTNQKYCSKKCFSRATYLKHRQDRIRRAVEYNKKNPQLKNKNNRTYTKNLKNKFFEMYGNKCSCCGENNIKFLTLQHINNDGSNERGKNRSSNRDNRKSYRIATKEYKPDKYETLCWNCNCASFIYGICPHKDKIDAN